MNKKMACAAAGLAFFALFAASQVVADVYKYTAPNGAVYYTEEPPNSNYKLIIKKGDYQSKRSANRSQEERDLSPPAGAEKEDALKELGEMVTTPAKDRKFPTNIGGIRLGDSRESFRGRLKCDTPIFSDLEVCILPDRPGVAMSFENDKVIVIQYVWSDVGLAEVMLGAFINRFGEPKSERSPSRQIDRIGYEFTEGWWWERDGAKFIITMRTAVNIYRGESGRYHPSVALRRVRGD